MEGTVQRKDGSDEAEVGGVSWMGQDGPVTVGGKKTGDSCPWTGREVGKCRDFCVFVFFSC